MFESSTAHHRSGSEPHAAQQAVESPVRPQGIEQWLDSKGHEQRGALGVGLLEVVEGLLLVVEPETRRGLNPP